MRYVVATGEPVVTGFMRTPPSSTMWAWVYALFYFLQAGWPAWAATAAGAVFFLFAGRLAGPGDVETVYLIGIGTFLACIALLLVGRRIERTLEILNWILVSGVLGSFLVSRYGRARPDVGRDGARFLRLRHDGATLRILPEGVDFFLFGALAAFAGAGGYCEPHARQLGARQGLRHEQHAGYIPAAVAGKSVNLTHHGFAFAPNAESMRRWRGWWRIVRADQWGIFFTGSLLGMALPALLYVTFLPHGTEIRGLGISAALAQGVGGQLGPLVGVLIGILGAWLLFKTQLDTVDAITRSVTDILWIGSRRLRSWRGGDVRAVYYSVLALVVLWGVIALRLAQPIMLLQIGANVAGVVLTIASIHLLYINCRLLAPELRPPMWRRVVLVCMSIFYGCFAGLSLWSLL